MNIFRRLGRAVRGANRDDDPWAKEKPFPGMGMGMPYYMPPPPAPPPMPWGDASLQGNQHDHSKYSKSDHYAQCSEVWDQVFNRWMHFDPKTSPSNPSKGDEHLYFCVTSRYQDRFSDQPQLILTHFAEPLRSFVVVTCSSYGNWEGSPALANEVDIRQAFRTLKKTKAKYDDIRDARSSKSSQSIEEKLALVRTLGGMAFDNRTPVSDINTYLKNLEKQLKAFISYLDEKFKPTAERLASAIRYGYMEYDLLPYYFEPGQDVFYTQPNDGPPLAMKIFKIDVCSQKAPTPTGQATDLFASVSVEGHALEWTGNAFETTTRKEWCPKFSGSQELSKVPVQLLTPEKRAELTARGRRYKAEAGIRYRICNGDRIVLDRLGYMDALQYDIATQPDENNNAPPMATRRGRQTASARRLKRKPRRDSSWDPEPFRAADNASRNNWARVQFPPPLPQEQFLKRTENGELPDDLLCFLPTELSGYNLVKKEWETFALDDIEPVIFDTRAWDHLVLDTDVKTLIKGLVQVSTKSRAATGALVNDVIARKGGGLTSVLYGPPGTGKTLTAEAVAELLKRPLFTVGSSDLPRDPAAMEETLTYVLKLATVWDAVLLIDEADVFLEQRSLHEIERNALVSVALRVLEYHRGVVFLTTNRIKVFDEAFLSRFSIAIKYPELDKNGRYTIWSRFLELAGYKIVSSPFVTNDDLNEKIIPQRSIEDLAVKKFNGRTIKNMVRTAQALALSEDTPLRMDHIHIVVRTQEKFLNDFAVERIQPE